MPKNYPYLCLECGNLESRYRNSRHCRKCGGDIIRFQEEQDIPAHIRNQAKGVWQRINNLPAPARYETRWVEIDLIAGAIYAAVVEERTSYANIETQIQELANLAIAERHPGQLNCIRERAVSLMLSVKGSSSLCEPLPE